MTICISPFSQSINFPIDGLLQYSTLLSLKRVSKHLTFSTKFTKSFGKPIFAVMELTINTKSF